LVDRHLADTMFHRHNYDLLFGWQTFDQHNVWLVITATTLSFGRQFPGSIVSTNFQSVKRFSIKSCGTHPIIIQNKNEMKCDLDYLIYLLSMTKLISLSPTLQANKLKSLSLSSLFRRVYYLWSVPLASVTIDRLGWKVLPRTHSNLFSRISVTIKVFLLAPTSEPDILKTFWSKFIYICKLDCLPNKTIFPLCY